MQNYWGFMPLAPNSLCSMTSPKNKQLTLSSKTHNRKTPISLFSVSAGLSVIPVSQICKHYKGSWWNINHIWLNYHLILLELVSYHYYKDVATPHPTNLKWISLTCFFFQKETLESERREKSVCSCLPHWKLQQISLWGLKMKPQSQL